MNDGWKKFHGIMREIIEVDIPKHNRTIKRRPWVTREVQRKRRPKTKSWKKFHQLKEETKNGLDCEMQQDMRI